MKKVKVIETDKFFWLGVLHTVGVLTQKKKLFTGITWGLSLSTYVNNLNKVYSYQYSIDISKFIKLYGNNYNYNYSIEHNNLLDTYLLSYLQQQSQLKDEIKYIIYSRQMIQIKDNIIMYNIYNNLPYISLAVNIEKEPVQNEKDLFCRLGAGESLKLTDKKVFQLLELHAWLFSPLAGYSLALQVQEWKEKIK